MSTQSAPCPSNNQVECELRGQGSRRVSLSVSELAGAADAAYSAHSRLDLGNDYASSTCNLHGNTSEECGFQLKKRKTCYGDTSFGISINADFLSGIFEDIAIANANSQPTECESPHPSRDDQTFSRKKSRISLTRSMSRCPKSFACLHSISEDRIDESESQSDQGLSSNVSTVSNSGHELFKFDSSSSRRLQADIPDSTLLSVESNEVNNEANNAAAIVDTIFNMDLPLFPNLPASVSNSSNSSNNLTQSSVQAVTEAETTHNHIEGEETKDEAKDGYGWFIETEDDVSADAVSSLTAVQQAQHKDIAFKIATAPKSENYDAELEWARAADTVDDVLADFF